MPAFSRVMQRWPFLLRSMLAGMLDAMLSLRSLVRFCCLEWFGCCRFFQGLAAVLRALVAVSWCPVCRFLLGLLSFGALAFLGNFLAPPPVWIFLSKSLG